MIEKQFEDHIKNQLELGNIILFTGAGFSLSAKNKLNINLPTGNQLAESLWKQIKPDKAFDNGTLEDVFSAAMLANKGKTAKHLREMLNVDSASLPTWYATYLKQPWHKIYTLNVDNLWTACLAQFKINRGHSITSATTNKTVKERGDWPVSIVHLNGTYEDIPDSVVFSIEQYTQRLLDFDHSYTGFAAEFATKPVIFVGTPIDETPFWKHIQMRKVKNRVDGQRELRPRSYLVTPTISEARKDLLAEYNIVHLPLTAEKFAEWLSQNSASTQKGVKKIQSEIKNYSQVNDLNLVSSLISVVPPNDPASVDFLLGVEPKWKDIIDQKAIFRSFEKIILDKFETIFKNPTQNEKIILLTGTAGDGKTTTAMRIGAQLTSTGKNVVWLDSNYRVKLTELPTKLFEMSNVDVLIIDNAESYGSLLSQTINKCLKEKIVKAVLLVTRSTKVDKILIHEEITPFTSVEVSTTRLDDNEILSLIKVLQQNNKLGVLLKKSLEDQIATFKSKADRQMLVALIEATSGKAFDERILSEYTDLDTKNQSLYLLIALATHFKFSLDKEDILIAAPSDPPETLNILDSFVRRGLIIQKQGTTSYQLRHRLISDRIVDDLNTKGVTENLIKDLGFIAGVRLQSHETLGITKSPYKDLLVRAINHETLVRMINYDAAGRVYVELEEVLKNYYHYWLQRGRLELESGHLSNARLCISHAKALSPQDDYVETAEAHLDFREAWTNPTAQDSTGKVQKSIERLEQQITQRGKLSSIPFHILGTQIVQWTKRANLSTAEKKQLLEKAKGHVEQGLKHHFSEKKLTELANEIHKEYLSLALYK